MDLPSYAQVAATTAAAAAVTTYATDDFVSSKDAGGHGKSAQALITSAEAATASLVSKAGIDAYNRWKGNTDAVITKYEHVVMTGMTYVAVDALTNRLVYKRPLKWSVDALMRSMLFGTGVAFIGDTLASDWLGASM